MKSREKSDVRSDTPQTWGATSEGTETKYQDTPLGNYTKRLVNTKGASREQWNKDFLEIHSPTKAGRGGVDQRD